MADEYEVMRSELKLDDDSRHPPGSVVSSENLTEREEEVFLEHGEIQPVDEDDGGEAETSIEHDVPPDDDGGDEESADQDSDEDEGEELDWRNDYHDARSKAAELDLDSNGTHEELIQRIEGAL